MITTVSNTPLEFSRLFEIGRLPQDGIRTVIAATPDECAAIAKRAGIPLLADLRVDYHLQFLPHSDVLTVTAQIAAQVTQICVRSLEPFTHAVHFTFTAQAMEQNLLPAVPVTADEVAAEAEITDEGFEPIINRQLDLGELAVQQFLLELDPYPKNPDAEPLSRSWEMQDGDTQPMSILKSLKSN